MDTGSTNWANYTLAESDECQRGRDDAHSLITFCTGSNLHLKPESTRSQNAPITIEHHFANEKPSFCN